MRSGGCIVVGGEGGTAAAVGRIHAIFNLAELDECIAAVQAKLAAVNGITAQGIGLIETQRHRAVRHGDGGLATIAYSDGLVRILGVAVGGGDFADGVLCSRQPIDSKVTYL